MIAKRIYNAAVISSVLDHRLIKRHFRGDVSDDVEYPIIDSIYYIAVYIDDEIVGVFLGVVASPIILNGHMAVLPKYWGGTATEAGKLAIEWVFTNTPTLKITGTTPASNKAAIRYNLSLGGLIEGVNKNSILEKGILADQFYFGLEKARWEWTQ